MLPYNCYQPDEISASYAATLKYLKKNSSIPVPKVYAYEVQSSPENKVNATYILMEYLPGHALPTLDSMMLEEPNDDEIEVVKKVHTQLADTILELGTFIVVCVCVMLGEFTLTHMYYMFLVSLKFDKIGCLREDSDGNVFVGPYHETKRYCIRIAQG